MAADELRSEVAIFGDPDDRRSVSLAENLKVALKPRVDAPDTWHLVAAGGNLEISGPNGIRFALSEAEIEQRLMGFSQSSLAKACAASRMPRIFDALSGWGTDGLTLSMFGCEVVSCEINPLVATLSRSRVLTMAPEMLVLCCDANDYLRCGSHHFDVIYLDAMFPEHPKGARPSKSLQVLAALAESCDLSQTLKLARCVAADRVVVKRRRNQAPEDEQPAWSVEGKTVRFDVYRSSSM